VNSSLFLAARGTQQPHTASLLQRLQADSGLAAVFAGQRVQVTSQRVLEQAQRAPRFAAGKFHHELDDIDYQPQNGAGRNGHPHLVLLFQILNLRIHLAGQILNLGRPLPALPFGQIRMPKAGLHFETQGLVVFAGIDDVPLPPSHNDRGKTLPINTTLQANLSPPSSPD
jgi:hypothetical protein